MLTTAIFVLLVRILWRLSCVRVIAATLETALLVLKSMSVLRTCITVELVQRALIQSAHLPACATLVTLETGFRVRKITSAHWALITALLRALLAQIQVGRLHAPASSATRVVGSLAPTTTSAPSIRTLATSMPLALIQLDLLCAHATSATLAVELVARTSTSVRCGHTTALLLSQHVLILSGRLRVPVTLAMSVEG